MFHTFFKFVFFFVVFFFDFKQVNVFWQGVEKQKLPLDDQFSFTNMEYQ